MPVQQQLLGEVDAASRHVKEHEGAASRQVKEFREEEVMEDLSYHTQEFLEPHGPDMWRQALFAIFDIQGNIIIKEDISRMSEERLNKAYPCQYCGMSFAQNWLLKRSSS